MNFLQAYWPYLGMAACALAWLYLKYGDKLKWPAAPAGDEDVADLQAAKRLQARFKRLNCPEGTAAMKTALDHFFHGGEA